MNKEIPASATGETPAPKKTILLVDDTPDIRHLFCGVLLRAGYHVHQASDAAEAQAIVSRGVTIHVLLTDYHMPGLNGAELGKWFQQHSPSVPVVIISSSIASVQLASRALTNALCFLKPTTPQELLDIVQNALDGPAPASCGSPTP